MGQFERTLIIVDEGAYVHYVEGCTAPIYKSDSLHSAVVEIIVKKDARCRYTTIQNWSNTIVSKSVARAGGRTSYRGLVNVQEGAEHSKSNVKCDALLVDTVSRSDTYPYVDVREDDVEMAHEATVSKVSEDQLFYLMSRGMTEDEAMATIVRGFVEPIARELPMEYALELNRLIELQMEGAVG
jgi:Fe-S cluster assembly protein SufB